MDKFDAEEFLELSKRLVCHEPNEAGYRTAINRAYYACHLIGCESTAKKGWFTPQYNGRDHAGLWRTLKGKNTWGYKLQVLYELREHADYHIDTSQQSSICSCSYCDDSKSKTALVDKNIWIIARDIANDLLPRLQSIMPS